MIKAVTKLSLLSLAALLAGCGGTPGGIDPQLYKKYQAGNEKLGQVYYEQVCSRCHKAELGRAISPADKASREWDQLFGDDRHGQHPQPLSYFFSAAYRQQASHIEVVQVYRDLPAEQLRLGLYKFAILGAKDSDMPHACK